MRIFVAITGSSGMVYTRRFLELLVSKGIETHLTISQNGGIVLEEELGIKPDLNKFDASCLITCTRGVNIKYYRWDDLNAPFASGSKIKKDDAFVIIPCSMGTLGRIASGYSQDLITRAADVFLKERKKLVLVIRETPLNYIHIKNMASVTRAGGIILPASPGFYTHPKTIDDMVNFVVERVMAQIQV